MSPVGGIVIVGGGPAGLATARAFRERGGQGPVTILSQERHPPYERPPLTKEFLRGESEASDLPIEEAGWYAEHEVELRGGVTVESLDPDRYQLTLAGGERVPYDRCVLATGSEPVRLPVPGGDDPDVHVIRRIEHADSLREHGERVVVIGSGFIGCEAAVSLCMRGAKVTMVSADPLPQVTRLGPEVGGRIAGWVQDAGAELLFGGSVEAIERDGSAWVVRAGDGVAVQADTVLQAVGIAPNTALASASGLGIAQDAIATDAHMQASASGIYAVGDVACAHNAAAGRRLRVEHWGEALEHGSVAGAVLAGEDREWAQAPGFWSVMGERTLKYVAWGDGYETVRVDSGADGAFTAWYADADGVCVGVLAHERDSDYELGRELVESGAPLP